MAFGSHFSTIGFWKTIAWTKTRKKDPDDNDEPEPTCKHTRVSRHGSNQYVSILKCKDCNHLLSKTPKPAAAD